MYEGAGLRPDRPPLVTQLAARLHGNRCLAICGHDEPAPPGALFAIRSDVAERQHFELARCLARHELLRVGTWSADREAALAAFLVAPTPAVLHLVREVGLDVEAVARAFAITQTCAALRLVEVGATDGVVITPQRVYRRGRALSWVSDAQARRLAARGAHLRAASRVPLTDEPGRLALFRSLAWGFTARSRPSPRRMPPAPSPLRS